MLPCMYITSQGRLPESQKHAVVSPLLKALSTLSQKSETVAEFGDSRRFLRQSHFSATVWTGHKKPDLDSSNIMQYGQFSASV